MSLVFNPPRARSVMPETSPQSEHGSPGAGVLPAALCALAILAVGGPQFVRMPLTNDAALYDLQAGILRDGGVLYRDILEPNLPGIVWLHVFVRSLFGESSEALRLFDLTVVGGVIALSAAWMRRAGASARSALWFAAISLLFYLSLSEWCHCQRDMWMLLPSIAALTLRSRQTLHWLTSPDDPSTAKTCSASVMEGLLWGAGVWIKPYVALPGLAAWIVSQLLVRRRRFLVADSFGLLGGGLLAGAAGVTWLMQSGAWDAFYATVTDWNPRYFQAGREHWTQARLISMAVRLWPWSLLHVVATPLAVTTLWRSMRCGSTHLELSAAAIIPLLAAFYLAWTAQAFCLQHLFDYVHAPALLIALLFLATVLCSAGRAAPRAAWRYAGILFILCAVVSSPLLQSKRLQAWSQSVRGPNDPRLQDRLAHFDNPNREDLARLAEFLRRSDVHDRDVCFYNSDLVSLYGTLGLRPPTRFVYVFELLVFFPDRSGEIGNALEQSGHTYVVTDLVSCGMSRELAEEIGPEGPLAPPPAYHRVDTASYPWSQPVVYRSGTYLVHRVKQPLGNIAVEN